MKARLNALALIIGFLFSLWLFSAADQSVQGQSLIEKLEGIAREAHDQPNLPGLSPNLENDTADVLVEHTTAYPGSKECLVSVLLRNPGTAIAGFDFDVVINPEWLADFSTIRIYVDSVDTCPAPEDTCWYYFPIRECLIESHLTENWMVLEAHGEVGDTTKPDCDQMWVLGIAITGTPIPPGPNYRTLFSFGVDISCVSDSLTDRTATFFMTGHLSDPAGALVPVRIHQGELLVWWSVPGDANDDSLVNGADIVFLINYLFQHGPEPCVMEAADPNADCTVDPADVVYLINYLFREGSPPAPGCAH